MDCLLIKVTSTKPRVKLPSLQLNTYYPLTELDSELKQICSKLKKPLVLSMKLVESTQKKQEVEFKKLELDKGFESLLYLLNEDIFQSERDAEFDEAEQFRQLSMKLASQFESEKKDIGPYLIAADEMNKGFLSKLIKRPLSKANKESNTPVIQEKIVEEKKPKFVAEKTLKVEEPIQTETVENVDIPTNLSPVWEDEVQEEIKQDMPADLVEETKSKKAVIDKSHTSSFNSSKKSFLSFESFLQIKGDNQLLYDAMEELTKEKSEPIESVAEALGINTIQPSPLEEKQLEFIRKRMDRQLFHRLQINFSNNINQLESSLNNTLEKMYLGSGLVEHDLRAFVENKRAEREKELGATQNAKFNKLKNQLSEEKSQKLETLNTKHQSELQELKTRQLDEKQHLVSDFDIYSEDKLEKLKVKLSEELENELNQYQVELQSERQENLSIQLISEKEKLLSRRNEAILNEVNDLQKEKQTYYESLLNELVEKENDFLLLIKQEETNVQLEKDRVLKERELDIKQEEVNILSSEKEQKLKQQSEQYELMMNIVQAQLLNSSQNGQENLLPKTIEVNVPSAFSSNKPMTSNFRKLLYSVGILSVLAVSVLGTKLYQANEENNTIKTEVSKIEKATQQLSDSMIIMADENKKLKKQLTESQDSLGNLLAEEDYNRATELYPKELDKIENAMYEAGDLKQLRDFNKVHSTQLGLLDEAILSGNDEKIIEEYNKLNPTGKLPGNRDLHIPQKEVYEGW
ncbi:hypothetical protein [Vagococcus fluvialis]|uniref:hypothetical protein n=1 Tax=Vagococcus fluvialis TaxID=2738 RepID=UPI0028F7228B|nr:hypothetical protein [Vagococcus fluvialis]WNF91529.1 hypothetical protein QDW48_13940 [Vagococcus fluvialis]